MSTEEKKVKRFKVKHYDGTTVVHYDGAFHPADMALCGSDLMGDRHLGWDQAVEVQEKVNCVQCIIIIAHVKKILHP